MDVRRSAARAVKPLSNLHARPLAPRDVVLRGPARVRDVFEAVAPAKVKSLAATPFTPPTRGAWTVDRQTGKSADPVTLYVHGSLTDLEDTLAKAGWTKADPQGLGASIRYVGAALQQECLNAITYAANHLRGLEIGLAGVFGIHFPEPAPLPPPHVDGVDRMPVSAQTLDGKPFVSAWECNNNPLGGRDHVRIFDTGQRDSSGLPVYAISPILDTGIRFAPDHPESGFMFHTVAPDAAPERDKFLGLLTTFGNVSGLKTLSLPFGGPSSLGEKVLDASAFELTLKARHALGSGSTGQTLLAAR